MTRQRGYHQYHRLAFETVEGGRVIAETLEAAQLTERLVDLHTFVDGHIHTVHLDRLDTEGRLLVIFAQPVDQVIGGRNALSHLRLTQRRERIAVELGSRLSKVGKGLHERALGFVDLVEHERKIPVIAAGQYSSFTGCTIGGQPPISHRQSGHDVGMPAPSRSLLPVLDDS